MLLSLGTGLKSEYDAATNASRGLVQWGFKILSLVFQGNVGLVDYQCRQLLGERYMRVNPELPGPFTIDDTSKINQLIAIADQIDLAPLLQWLDLQWLEHTDPEVVQARTAVSAKPDNGYAAFEQALKFTLKWEGGYVNDATDPGGATAFGITQRTYDAYRVKQRQPLQPVAIISSFEIRAIYYAEYWLAGRCQSMLAPLNTVFFDTCVNFGVHGATKFLQTGLNVVADGSFGPITAKKLSESIPLAVAWSICSQRISFRKARVKKHPQYEKFLQGWLNRDYALQSYIRAHVDPSSAPSALSKTQQNNHNQEITS